MRRRPAEPYAANPPPLPRNLSKRRLSAAKESDDGIAAAYVLDPQWLVLIL